MFKPATKKQAKARVTMNGPAGSGKTLTSLKMARALVGPQGRIALVDTEHGSAALYSPVIPFDSVELDEFSIKTYLATIQAAKGYDALVIDSLSHAWNGKGGALEQVDKMGGSKFSNGWKAVTPLQQELVEAILSFPGHVIATMRTKTAYEVVKDEHTGKMAPKRIGMAPVQRDGMEYEFGFMFDMDLSGAITVAKSRCLGAVYQVGEVVSRDDMDKRMVKLVEWLNDGAEVSAVDQLGSEIRTAISREVLQGLVPRLSALPEADRGALRDLYQRRLVELTSAVEVGGF